MHMTRSIFWVGLLAVLAAPALLFAADYRSGDRVDVRVDEKVNDDVYAGGGSITSAGEILGDLYAGGGSVFVGGTVGQDAVICGGTVTISGNITDDLRVGGVSILVQGAVGGDVLAGGGDIRLNGNRIGGDALIGGGSVRIDAPVGGDVKIGGGDVFINSAIEGNVEVYADKLTLGSRALIRGNLKYKSAKVATIENGAQVLGQTTFEERKKAERGTSWASVIFPFLMLLVGAMALGLLFRKYMSELVRNTHARTFKEFLRGIIFLIVFPIASIILLITVIGIPLGILGLVSFVGAIIFAVLTAPIILGSLIYRSIRKQQDYEISWRTILLGVFVFSLLGMIPILGWAIQMVFVILALGGGIWMKWSAAQAWR